MSGSTPRRIGAGAPLRGLFVDGVWHCDCTPQQPANHFEVKKQGPNQGRWCKRQDAASTCQKQPDDKSRCKFFLWDSDAHPREAAALANNSRTESSHTKIPSKRPASPPPPYTIGSESREGARKRERAHSIDLDDEFGFKASDEAFEDDLLTTVDTPRKAARTSTLVTPSTRRTLPWNVDHSNGIQMPQTATSPRAGPSSSNSRECVPPSSQTAGTPHRIATPSSSPYEMPRPSRSKYMGSEDLAHEVSTLLQNARIKLDVPAENDLMFLLTKHMKATEGLKRGRDVARSTIKARDAKVTELSYRINTLEAELEAEKALVRHLQWEIETEDSAS
ncbi:hypothetical protein C7974DRAFT_411721 [Boeremia exigua]|uniref:uncharacterized protein n=1 Tax=Boeremia exigua TaxID=749465 RepID=UPI001E8EE021|nr:uncharacterized protein C7974DRAFT_411721 [Boeremia exigua]KAH6638285.1 hypothetical protein C7974DRAFT_411721 [Boeremia exigua]